MRMLKITLIAMGTLVLAVAVLAGLGSYYKKEILLSINETVNASINGNLKIGDADWTFFSSFPNVGIRLDSMELRSKNTDVPLFSGGRLLLSIRMLALLRGRIEFKSVRLVDAEMLLFRSTAGEWNTAHLRKDTVAGSKQEWLELTNGIIELNNVHVRVHDSVAGKFFSWRFVQVQDILSRQDSALVQQLDGSVFFDSLTFNPQRGSFLKNVPTDLSLHVWTHPQQKSVRIDSGWMKLPHSLLKVTMSAKAEGDGRLLLSIKSDSLLYEEGLRVLPTTLATRLSPFGVSKPFPFQLQLIASLGKPTEPQINVLFSMYDHHVTSKWVRLDHTRLRGTFTNQKDTALVGSNANSELHLSIAQAEMQRIPFAAEAWLSDLTDPRLRLRSEHVLEAQQLQPWLDSTQWRVRSGRLNSTFSYEGKLAEYLDSAATEYHGKLRGSLRLDQGSVEWVPRQLTFDHAKLRVAFNEDTVWIDTLEVHNRKNQLRVGGYFVNYVPFFITPSSRAGVRLKVTSPALDLSTLLVKKKTVSKKKAQEAKARLSRTIDQLLSSVDVQLAVNVRNLSYGAFVASQVSGAVRLNKNQMELKGVRMNFGGGTVTTTIKLTDLDRSVSPLDWKASCSNVRIATLFQAFRNFNQSDVKAENIEGLISTEAHLRAKMDNDYSLVAGSITGPVRWTVKKGAINNLPAFQKLSDFLLKRRDFEHVTFAQVDGHMEVKGTEMEISRMEIQSSVLGLFVEGVYSLGKKTDLTIQVPLSNLKKRDKNFQPQNTGTGERSGASVFLVARPNESGQMSLSYDLFHRFRKKK